MLVPMRVFRPIVGVVLVFYSSDAAETTVKREEEPPAASQGCAGPSPCQFYSSDAAETTVKREEEPLAASQGCAGPSPCQELRTSISPSSAVELNTTSVLANYATEEWLAVTLCTHHKTNTTGVWDSAACRELG
uniref:(California timema) hypothetical protein n=1 Tax=Timema californicum TaxID=61474 RepID=A0A7R9J395_TIMCA|nr:unnamed protein product [Timema californicum]